MKDKVQLIDKNWKLSYDGNVLNANVPGDITLDLYHNGTIADPYFGLNHKDLHWITDTDFTYETVFSVEKSMLSAGEVLLEFDAIDTFAEVIFNGIHLGTCENMFLKYSFSVKEILKEENNVLQVKMHSVTKHMEKIDDKGYFGVFNTKRLFIRKAQCHFGWDWAPDMPGYGICGQVRLVGCSKFRIEDVHYHAYNNGNLSIFAELNFSVRPQVDSHGNILHECHPAHKEDILRYVVAKRPGEPLSEENSTVLELRADGKKNFANFKIENPKLWYPVGYGEQPLYAYSVSLIHQGEVISEKEGLLAFREVELQQKPIDASTMGYRFFVNGLEIFVKGTNWVPAECFIGSIRDEKYERLISQAAEGNFNMLRVWGGGLYEKDIFYELCDKKGLLVWQDLMFACSDIPDNDPAFTENVKKEVEYQVRRLRNHPSIIYWCGGNEKTGTYGLMMCHGDYFVNVILRGLVLDLDETRPYARQSPCAFTDIGNDKTSGESHAGSFEPALVSGIENYRDLISQSDVPFISECATMGTGSLQSVKKMFPEDKLWGLNEYWEDRMMDNPYSAVLMTFAQRQKYYCDTLYGESNSVDEFIAKSMTVHAEALRAEAEYARMNRARCGGIMNWMFTDIWPSATWAIVDYYCEPKQAYYQQKRSYEPVLLTFVQGKGGVTYLTLVNDSLDSVETRVEYGVKTLSGEKVWSAQTVLSAGVNGVCKQEVPGEYRTENSYLYAECVINGEKRSVVYSYNMWSDCHFTGEYDYETNRTEEGLLVTVRAKSFVKSLTLVLPENCRYTYSDNYFDMQAGETHTVLISGAEIDESKLVVTDFSREIAKL